MKSVRKARRRRLGEYRAVVESLELERYRKVAQTSCFCCACVWVHLEDDGFDAEGLRQLRQQTIDEAYRIDPTQLALGKVLGRGGNGCVYVGSYCSFPVAVKEMLSDAIYSDLQRSLEEDMSGETFAERERKRDEKINEEFTREFTNLRKLRHPNVVDMYGTVIIEHEQSHAFRRQLVMELCACSLRDIVRDENNPAPMGQALSWVRQAAAGLAAVHSQGLIHFDIKPANILIDLGGVAKVADLGIARQMNVSHSLTFNNNLRIGTPSYMAPELLRGDIERITPTIDIYSFGILLWEVIHRDRPHPTTWGLSVLFREVAQNGMRPNIDGDVPSAFAQLTQLCWHRDPKRRPTSEQLLAALEHIVPSQEEFPRLVSTELENDPENAEPFYVWDPEARTFLSDALFDSQDADGTCSIAFEDGQPGQPGVNMRNIVLARNLPFNVEMLHDLDAHVVRISHPGDDFLHGSHHDDDEIAEFAIEDSKEDDDKQEDDERGAQRAKQHNENGITMTNISAFLRRIFPD